MNKEKIKSLVNEIKKECENESLHAVILISDGKSLLGGAQGVLREQIAMTVRFIEMEAEKLGISEKEIIQGALSSFAKDDEDV